MKFIKRCIFIITIFILLTLVETTIHKNTIAITEDDKILVTGSVLDTKKNPVQGVTVTFKNTENSNTTSFTTDAKGEYYGTIANGKYTIQYSKGNYIAKEMKLTQYKIFNENLELAFVYPAESIELSNKIQLFNKKIVSEDNLCNFRRIDRSYTNDIKNQILGLQINSADEYAFHDKPEYEGNNSLAVVLTDDKSLQDYIDNTLSPDCKKGILPKNSLLKDIVGLIYGNKMLNIGKDKDNESILDTSSTNLSNEIEIDSTSIIDATIEGSELPEDNPQPPTPTPNPGGTVSSSDFIYGEIKKNGNIYSDVTGTVWLWKYYVTDSESGEGEYRKYRECQINSGKYSFDYPNEGLYYLSFELNHTNDFNPEYYVLDTAQNISEGATIINCLKESNSNLSDIKAEISEKYKDMDYKNESKLDNYTSNQTITLIEGKTNSFGISAVKDEEDLEENKIIANVNFVERDKFSLTVEKNVSRYKIVLNNGQIFKQYTFDNAITEHQHYRNLRLFNISMDTKLSYGAKLFVEYEIKVKNNSNIDCTGYTLLSTFENLEYDKNQYLLINSKKKNQNQGWVDKTDKLSEVNNLIDIDYTDDSNIMTYLTLKCDKLEKNTEKTHYVTLTRPLDAENDDTLYSGTTELVKYSNDEGRRNYSKTEKTGNPMDNVIKVGNYTSDANEADTYESEQIAILPPTGFDVKTLCLLLMSTAICLIAFKYLIRNKLYINIKKTKLKRKWNKY